MPEPKTNSTAIAGSSPVPCSPSSTPETDAALCRYDHPAWPGGRKFTVNEQPVVLADFCRTLERERDAALRVIEQIEERYIDGCDTYEDWKFMGGLARNFLFPENR